MANAVISNVSGNKNRVRLFQPETGRRRQARLFIFCSGAETGGGFFRICKQQER
jgi:hypothetical protein